MTATGPETAPPNAGSPLTVLLVDDQRFVGIALERLLAADADMVIHCCTRAADAMACACDLHPAIILQDLVMPDIDGLTMVRAFRGNPLTAAIPIIVLSANDDADVRAMALAAGANDYLVKLPAKADLVACIRRHAGAVKTRAGGNEPDAAVPAAAPLQDADETLDRNAIAAFREDDGADLPDFALSLIDLYIEDSASQVARIRDAGRRLDIPALEATAHSLKGSSLTMGAKRLAMLCARIEIAAHQRGVLSPDLMTELDREFLKVRSALLAERHSARSGVA